MREITYAWRSSVDNASLNGLLADAFGGSPAFKDWDAQLSRYSLGWVYAREGESLVGFVNVIGDGDVHAVLLDTAVAQACQRRGVGTRLVKMALQEAKDAGYRWVHVDTNPTSPRSTSARAGSRTAKPAYWTSPSCDRVSAARRQRRTIDEPSQP